MRKTCEELPLADIYWTFSHQFSSCFVYRQNNPPILGNLQYFSCTYFLVKQSGISAGSKMREVLAVHVSTWIYSVIYMIYSNIPEFILQRIFNQLISGKLGLSQRIKTKQVFIMFDWKDETSVEEEEKAIAIISYL